MKYTVSANKSYIWDEESDLHIDPVNQFASGSRKKSIQVKYQSGFNQSVFRVYQNF